MDEQKWFVVTEAGGHGDGSIEYAGSLQSAIMVANGKASRGIKAGVYCGNLQMVSVPIGRCG